MGQGKFVWFDLITPKADEAQKFYTELFGWEVALMESEGGQYRALKIGDEFIGGGIMDRDLPEGVPSHWLAYLAVDDVDQATQTALDNGGQNPMPPMTMGDIGRFSIITDPQGATVALYKAAGPQGEHELSNEPFHFSWNELYANDLEGAKTFYTKLTGWQYAEQDMGEAGVYTMPQIGEQSVAGMMQKPSDMPAPPHWLNYVSVPDTDAITEKAKSLGATLLFGPQDVPEVGRFSVLLDPVGAAFAVITFVEM